VYLSAEVLQAFETFRVGIAEMSRLYESKEGMLQGIGMCLMCVQSAERALEMALSTVFEKQAAAEKAMLEIVEGQKPTLGYFLKELRKRVKLEREFRDKLYRFLEYRNMFIHDLKEAPGGWDLDTAEGRKRAYVFLAELGLMAFAVQAVFLSAVTISAREELGEDITDESELVAMIERHFGASARKMLAARN
jgi:hypothetical protein